MPNTDTCQTHIWSEVSVRQRQLEDTQTFFSYLLLHVIIHNASQMAPNLNSHNIQHVKDALVKERGRLFDLLKEVPFLRPFPSHSNFILCEVTPGLDAKKLKVHSFSYLHIFILIYSFFVYVWGANLVPTSKLSPWYLVWIDAFFVLENINFIG